MSTKIHQFEASGFMPSVTVLARLRWSLHTAYRSVTRVEDGKGATPWGLGSPVFLL
jgi:hypothetical protein